MSLSLTYNKRLALVTGAGRGIGRAIALKLASVGCKVICVSRSESSCGSAAEAIREAGGEAEARAVDVADRAAVAAAAKEILDTFGTVEVLVNNAGITRDNLLVRMKDEEWDDVIQTNLSGAYAWVRNLAHPMARNRWGRIINITSVSGVMGNAGQINYASAKAGMIGMTKTLAKEFAARKITANAIAPGFIATDMTSDMGEDALKKIADMVPLKRIGEVEEIASLAAYLVSKEAGYMTGQILSVDGGLAI